MLEYKILQALGNSKDFYDDIRRHVNNSLLTPEGVKVLASIDTYYEHDSKAERVDWELLEATVLEEYQAVPKNQERFRDYFITLLSADVSAENVGVLVRTGLIQKTSLDLIDSLAEEATSAKSRRLLSRLQELLESNALDEAVDEEYTAMDVRELVEEFDPTSRIRPGPAALTEKLGGGLRRGHHLILFARPEVGKSMFALSMAANCLRQGLRVLYIGNEDPITDLIMRLISNLTGRTEAEVMQSPDDAMELARSNGYDNATFIGMSPGTIEDIDAACAKHGPDVLVIDQLRNLSASTENNTIRLDAVARGARNIGRRRNCLVISVTQAGDSAEGRMELNMGDVDGSNTGIPGACDVMVGVGMNETAYMTNTRCLSLPKNKVGRDHGHFVVRVHPQYSSVTSHENVPKLEVEGGQ
jgi:replicative DNA helicase